MTDPPRSQRAGDDAGAGSGTGARDALADAGTLHALDVLDLSGVLAAVAGRAASELGRSAVEALRPRGRPDVVGAELDRVAAVTSYLRDEPAWALPAVPDVRAPLREAGAEGSVLEAAVLHRIGLLMASSRRVRADLEGSPAGGAELRGIVERLVDLRGDEQAITRAVDEDGQVRDGASAELRRIRSQLRGAHARLVRKLEAYVSALPDRFVVADASVTVREGRYVVPIRREGKGEVGGIVHDESSSGATLFVEPPMAIGMMNELWGLERAEAREVHRILRELTGRLTPRADELRGALDALVELDSLVARARTALQWGASVPELIAPAEGRLEIVAGRHPLLVEHADHPVVPFDLTLEPGERAVVVSGPNTGGKSVFLKATGLIAALAQSGVVPPVGPGTRLPVFTGFFADIGDEQSISRSLSTFSAHLANLAEIVRGAGGGSLILIDEMGTGTDPAEGAALSRAILETLVARGALTLASSHLGDLKRLDGEGSGVVNASLQFDSDRMEPTYRLVKGRPGRSYGLAIARGLGFPPEVLDAATGYVDEGERRMEELLSRLETQEREARETLRAVDEERAAAERLRGDVESREAGLREAERDAERRAREEARELLLAARAEVDAAIEEVKGAARDEAELAEAARTARRRVERAARKQRPPPRDRAGAAPALDPGDYVRVIETGARGTVVELRGDRALVETGALRLEVPTVDLVVETDEPEPPRAEPTSGWSGPTGGTARVEVDLRGLRVDEMELELARAMDQAIIDDLAELRIIHGKGTGALRKRVDELLRSDRRVREHRMGGPGEGGAGVTVASFGSGS